MKTQCNYFSHLENGEKVYSLKKKYNSLDDAILIARIYNAEDHSIHKLVAYKCNICLKYHIGKTNKMITDKERLRYKKLLNENS